MCGVARTLEVRRVGVELPQPRRDLARRLLPQVDLLTPKFRRLGMRPGLDDLAHAHVEVVGVLQVLLLGRRRRRRAALFPLAARGRTLLAVRGRTLLAVPLAALLWWLLLLLLLLGLVLLPLALRLLLLLLRGRRRLGPAPRSPRALLGKHRHGDGLVDALHRQELGQQARVVRGERGRPQGVLHVVKPAQQVRAPAHRPREGLVHAVRDGPVDQHVRQRERLPRQKGPRRQHLVQLRRLGPEALRLRAGPRAPLRHLGLRDRILPAQLQLLGEGPCHGIGLLEAYDGRLGLVVRPARKPLDHGGRRRRHGLSFDFGGGGMSKSVGARAVGPFSL